MFAYATGDLREGLLELSLRDDLTARIYLHLGVLFTPRRFGVDSAIPLRDSLSQQNMKGKLQAINV